MTNQLRHADDAELSQLVFGDDDRDEYRVTAAHVEACEECQIRLTKLATSAEFDSDVNRLLSSYPDATRLVPSREGAQRLDFLSPPSHPEMLGRLGRYEVERVIGSGGMGVVLKAFDTELNRPVAIKVLAQHLAPSGAARQRFAREAKAAAAVVHEHVVAIHNVESDSDVPFLVMQYVSGESLQARIDREGPLEAMELLRIGMQVAAGLAAAHQQGVIHRDVKPANILLENSVERVLLTDFGLARTVDDASLTYTGVVAGTPHYMSPEQASGEPTDQQTDLFSLGAVLYFTATGHPPFRAERAMGVLNRICHESHRPVWHVNNAIPDELSEIIDRLLEKRPARRFSSAAEVQAALSRLLAKWQQYGISPRRKPNKAAGRIVGAAGIAVIAGAAMVSVLGEPYSRSKSAASAPSDDAGPAEASMGFAPLFEGTSLEGFEQHGGGAKFTIEDGAIVGTAVPDTPNSFLCTKKEYGDFILEVEFKVDAQLNSGIQIRSHVFGGPTVFKARGKDGKFEATTVPAGRVHGYQVEIDPSPRAWTGGIFDEGRRGWLYSLVGAEHKAAREAFKQGEWNHCRIEARGDSIKTWVNGVPAADLKDDMTLQGRVGFQVHGVSNDGKQVRWRNIRIKELESMPDER
jgi:serine/threonine protein kinase